MRLPRIASLLFCLLGLQACSAVVLSVASMVGGIGIEHTLNGMTYKTFIASVPAVRLAVHKALREMEIGIVFDREDPTEIGMWHMQAKAADRTIDIELETLTRRTTRMRVIVSTGIPFLKDAATGKQIIAQATDALGRLDARRVRIASAQYLLTRLGFSPGIVDGVAGPQTRAAINRFRKRHSLTRDASVTPELIDDLRQRDAALVRIRRKEQERLKRARSEPEILID